MMKSLRLAFLAPLKRPITPRVTASRPRVMFDLIQGLVARGHEATVFGAGDSQIPASQLVPVIPQSLTSLSAAENPFYRDTAAICRAIMMVVAKSRDFDIVHNHMYPEFLPLLALPALRIPMVTTVHAQMTSDLAETLKYFQQKTTLVAISEAARRASGLPLPVIHHGVDTDFFVPDPGRKREYLLFVGRMSRAKYADGSFMDPKGVGQAMAVAQVAGERLKIVGNVEDPAFFEQLVKPHLSEKIEFVGEVSSEQTQTREEMRWLFQGAKALIFSINWEEPFGLVMVEAMACGVPVVAFNRGSVREIVVDGKTGFVIDPHSGVEGLVVAIGRLGELDPEVCRRHTEAHFSLARMVGDYEALYTTFKGSTLQGGRL